MNCEIRKKLDRIVDILWTERALSPTTYIEQISNLIYLKLLDEKETSGELVERLTGSDIKTLYPKQAQRFRWSKFRLKSGDDLRDFMRDEVFPYMGNLVKQAPRIT